jgi:hypothetical protein
MRRLTRGLLLTAALLLLPTVATATDLGTTTAVRADPPKFPTPIQSAVLGLSLTAVAVIGARVTQRSAGTMMYIVLATVSVTGVFIAASHRIHSNFDEATRQTISHMQQAARQ